MSSPNKTEQPLSDRKTAILDAAANLFAERGYAAVSIRDLAQATHITPAALYHHFPDKDAIYDATLRHVFSDKASAIASVMKGADALEITLERLIIWLTREFSENPVMSRLVQRELLAGDRNRIRLLTEDVIAVPFREIQHLMQQLAPYQDARLSAASIISLVMGFIELSPILEGLTGERNNKKRLSEFAAHAKHLVLYGLLTPPRSKEIL
jgi:AcrR family transcriptional regulator